MEILNNAIARRPAPTASVATFADLVEVLERASNMIAKGYKAESLEVLGLALGLANNLEAQSVKPEIFRAINLSRKMTGE